MPPSESYIGLTPGAFEAPPAELRQLAFDHAEYAGRLARVRERMAAEKIDMLYVTTPDHVCYLHCYVASWYKANSPMRYPQLYGTAIHVDHDQLIHFDNPTEMPVLASTSVCTDLRFFKSREAAPNLAFIIAELKAKGWLGGTLAMEHWSYIPNRAISTMLEGAFLAEGCRVVDGSAILRGVRRVKSAAELDYIRKGVALADVGHAALRQNLRPGITELELFGEVTRAMMAAGSAFPALIPIFSAMPVRDGRPVSSGHAMAGRRVIAVGDYVTADLCGVPHRYHGNVMRGYFLGDPPRAMVERHRLAGGVFAALRAEMRAGMTVRAFNAIARRYYESVGLWDQPGWALGYELGLSLPPDWVGEFFFNVRDDKYLDRVFEAGMVTNFESLFDSWLIDTLIYTASGVEVLSATPLELVAVDPG